MVDRDLLMLAEKIVQTLLKEQRPVPFFILKKLLPDEDPTKITDATGKLIVSGRAMITSHGIELVTQKKSEPRSVSVSSPPNRTNVRDGSTDTPEKVRRRFVDTAPKTSETQKGCPSPIAEKQYSYDRFADMKGERANKNDFFLREMDLEKYSGQYISSQKIFQDNPAMMKKYDIKDSDELYHIMRDGRNVLQERYTIDFVRKPSIRFGDGDPIEQAISLIGEMSPADIEALTTEYEKRYGVKQVTARGFFSALGEYCENGVFDINKQKLDENTKQILKGKFTETLYLTKKVRSIFTEVIGKDGNKFVNSYNLKALGFLMAEKYIYSSKFRTAEDCFERYFRREVVFSVDPDLLQIPAVYTFLKKREKELTILPIYKDQYVDMVRLQKERNLETDLLREYSEAICSFVNDDDYFTLMSIESDGFYHPLMNLGFNEIFHEAILKQNPCLKTMKLFGTTVFRKADSATPPDFIDYVVSRVGSMDIYDFMETLKKKYSIVPERNRLLQYIRMSNVLYYNENMEKIYADRNEYYEEIGI